MEIVFRDVQLSFKEYAGVNLKYTWRQRKRQLVILVLTILFSTVSQAYFRGSTEATYSVTPIENILLITAILSLAIILVVFLGRRNLRRRYKATQFLQKPATYTFTDAGITVNAPTVQGVNAWETIDSLFLMRELAVLTTRNFTAYFLDFRCLEAPATEADFLALLQRHGAAIK